MKQPNLSNSFTSKTLLKKDVFSIVERGIFENKDCVLRRIDSVPWYSYPLAKFLLNLEKKSLNALNSFGSLNIAPPLLHKDNRCLIRGWLDGLPLHMAKPFNDPLYFSSAFMALRRLHRLKICHNDLAKEQNWLKGKDGKAILLDFQLAFVFQKRNFIFRTLAYEDLRHYLKHKKRYIPERLTPLEKMILGRKSLLAKIYTLTFKKFYNFITRGIFRIMDREGEGSRFHVDAPKIIDFLKKHQDVNNVIIVPFPDRKVGTGLYAFIETQNPKIRQILSQEFNAKTPEHIHLVSNLPKHNQQTILKLIALNQIDQIDSLILVEEKSLVTEIIAERKNLSDRISF